MKARGISAEKGEGGPVIPLTVLGDTEVKRVCFGRHFRLCVNAREKWGWAQEKSMRMGEYLEKLES